MPLVPLFPSALQRSQPRLGSLTINYFPRISVLINNHNYGHFLADAIDSVLAQSYRALFPDRVEVVVVDDGSIDSSAAVMASYGDLIVSVRKQNGGQDSAFNTGFRHCQGDIICLLDADDRFAPDKLSKIADCFAQHPDIGWCFHPMMLRDLRTGRPVGTTRAFPGANRNRSQRCDFRDLLRLGQLPFYPTATSGQCFRRSLLARILPMPETFANTSADRYLRVAAVGLMPGYFLADTLTTQGIHDSNVSTLRPERPSIPERQIVVAYMLRTRFPEFTTYANRLFSRGLNAYQSLLRSSDKNACVDPGYQVMIQDYWQLCSVFDQIAILLLRLYRKRPWRDQRPLDMHYYYSYYGVQRQATVENPATASVNRSTAHAPSRHHARGPILNSSNFTTADSGFRESK